MKKSGPADDPGRLLVCFDFEGSYGMPHKGAAYDLAGGASAILEELASQQARGVFFIVGRMIEEHPDVVQAIAAAGHEIGLHGYEHDSLARYDAEALALFDKNLARVGSLLEDMTGARPRAFRAPYLLWPNFYRHEVYEMLRAQGFRWVSNRYIRNPVELLHPRPGKLPMPYAWRASDGTPRLARNRPLTGLLNAQLVMNETFNDSRAARLRWLLGKRDPFTRDGMIRGSGPRAARLRPDRPPQTKRGHPAGDPRLRPSRLPGSGGRTRDPDHYHVPRLACHRWQQARPAQGHLDRRTRGRRDHLHDHAKPRVAARPPVTPAAEIP